MAAIDIGALVTAVAGEQLHFYVGPGVVAGQDEAIGRLPREGWMIRSVKGGLLLAGSEQSSTLVAYPAVSLFLEKHAGVRWLWPGTSGEVIPRAPKLRIPELNESGAPELKRRSFTFGYARYWDPAVKNEMKTYMARARLGDQFRANFGHSWNTVMPPSSYFEAHPDWYGLVSGKRVSLQLCVSNT